MDDFFCKYDKILKAATEWGVQSRYITLNKIEKDVNSGVDFIKACHRGYDRAQTTIYEELKRNNENKEIEIDEKEYREILLRRVLDGIAFSLLRTKSHYARRLVLHSRPPKINFKIVSEIKKLVDAYNRESRLTFSLLADLTTFIHIVDILKLDLRSGKFVNYLIEVKGGKVNSKLLEELEDEDNSKEIKEKIEEGLIEEKYYEQALRIVKQKKRVRDVIKILETDEGYNHSLNLNIKLCGSEVNEGYDLIINDLCKEANENGHSGAIVEKCVYLGIGFSSSYEEAKRKSIESASAVGLQAMRYYGSKDISDIINITKSMKQEELFKGYDTFMMNLYGMPDYPFTVWPIERKYKILLAKRQICMYTIFDVISFIFYANEIGYHFYLKTDRQLDGIVSKSNPKYFPRWGNKYLVLETGKGRSVLGNGFLAHVISCLKPPSAFLEGFNSSLDQR